MNFLYSFFIWLSDLMPGNNVGFAIVILALATHLIAYFLTKHHVRLRIRHQFINHKIQRLVDRGHEYIQQVYEDFTFTPWKGLGVSFLTAVIFVSFFFVIQYVITTSPGDISSLSYKLAFLPQHLNYQFMGVNIIADQYSVWYLVALGAFLFINLFLFVSEKWKFETRYDVRHFIEIVSMVLIVVAFMLLLSKFMFAAIIYWGVHICLSLFFEAVHHPHLADDIHIAMGKLAQRSKVEKKNAFIRVQNVINRMLIANVAKNFKLSKEEAATRFYTHMHKIHHHQVIDGIRFQLVGQPYVWVILLILISNVI